MAGWLVCVNQFFDSELVGVSLVIVNCHKGDSSRVFENSFPRNDKVWIRPPVGWLVPRAVAFLVMSRNWTEPDTKSGIACPKSLAHNGSVRISLVQKLAQIGSNRLKFLHLPVPSLRSFLGLWAELSWGRWTWRDPKKTDVFLAGMLSNGWALLFGLVVFNNKSQENVLRQALLPDCGGCSTFLLASATFFFALFTSLIKIQLKISHTI